MSLSARTATPALRLGPLQRYVDETRATVWVETDRSCEVEVLGHKAPTWSVHGHHYALVLIEGLEPGTENAYEVHLDGHRVWPFPDAEFGPSLIRTPDGDSPFRVAFGSCRRSEPRDDAGHAAVGPDALVAFATRLSGLPRSDWPGALLLLGDQVYADNPNAAVLAKLHAAHQDRRDDEVADEIGNFEEYTWLYDDAWISAPVRWLLSTVPVCMLLDDHDLRDDWNTSLSWREWATSQPWWRDRVVGAYASYWIYQHLGNLTPEQLEDDAVYAEMRAGGADDERSAYLDDLAWRADTEPDTVRWSFYRDVGTRAGGVRLVAIDSRCSRRLDPGDRAMVDDTEWAWIRRHTVDTERPVRHLLLASTLPFLLVPGLHHLEGWNEAVSEGAWGRRWAAAGEKIRQAVDLEHWGAFRSSFRAAAELLGAIAGRAEPPSSVLMLSGDVHTSYVAAATLEDYDHPDTAIHQLTMSPFRNPVDRKVRLANRLLGTRPMTAALRGIARLAGVRDTDLRWRVDHGPWFDNGIMTVIADRGTAVVEVEHAHGAEHLTRTARVQLAPRG